MPDVIPKLYIIGASGHGKVAADCAEQMACFREVVFLDAVFPQQTKNEHWDVVGKPEDALKLMDKNDAVFVAVGNNRTRHKLSQVLIEGNASFATLVHPTATVSQYAKVGSGTLICAGAIVNAFSRIGAGSIINTACNVDHDCHIGAYSHIAPSAGLAGNILIGQGSFIGIGSSIIQGLSVGEHCVLGAGSTLLTSLPDNVVAVGSPAKIIKSN